MANNNKIKAGCRCSFILSLLFILAACTTITPPQPTTHAFAAAPALTATSLPAPIKPKIITNLPDIQPLIAAQPHPQIPLTVWQRLRNGFNIIPKSHPRIRHEMRAYQIHRTEFKKLQQRAKPYLHYILDQVEQRQIPTEIALLPAIESNFRPQASSHRRAAGLWQFMPDTGKAYGLQQTWWYDGRQDVHASTTAALDYLQTLHQRFNSWPLALAAYNCGRSKVARIIRNSGQKNPTYWSIRQYLPKETRNYVPRLLALATLIADPQHHDVKLIAINNAPELTLVNVEHPINLALAADMAKLSLTQFKQFNPGYKRYNTGPGIHQFLLPQPQITQFKQLLSGLSKQQTSPWRTHHVKRGETLSAIAKKYHTEVALLQTTNQIKGHLIRIGQTLLVPASAPIQQQNLTANTYTVQQGDTLWYIATQHGLSVQHITALNDLKTSTLLQPGQQLVLDPET